MDIKKIKGINVTESFDIDALNSVVAKAHAGNALLFIGAGFSLGSKNANGTSMPLASELSKYICKLGGFEEDEDLAYSADYYLKYNQSEQLIDLLIRHFTIHEVESFHENIAQVDWRRVYTTNYDNCFEFAAGKVGKTIYPLTLEDNPSRNFRRRDVCVHINGEIQLLDAESLEKSFKLSESSYTSSDAFNDSSWLYRFKKDLDSCSQIIFVGYSLYDMEVKRLLVKNKDIKNKTSFITRVGVSTKEHHRLSAFGEVFPIGVERFGEMLGSYEKSEVPDKLNYLESLEKQSLIYDVDFTDSDVRDFLLRGRSDLNSIASSLTARGKSYSVERKQVDEIIECFEFNSVAVIHGSIANGKSVVAEQVAARLLLEGQFVYKIYDDEAKYEDDIEALSKVNRRIYLVVDDFEQNLDMVQYFISQLGDKGKLVLTERPHRYRRATASLRTLGVDPFTINVDYLRDAEIENFAELISNSGLWGDRAGLSQDKQIRYLVQDCESQLSVILLQLLKSPHVINLFKTSFKSVLEYPETKKTVHAICLIQHIYPKACTKSFISDISDTNHVYSSEFEERIIKSGLFEFKGNLISTRSSVFSMFILASLYKAAYTIDQLVRIAEKLQRNRSQQSYEEREMYRSIMTFGTLASILPEHNKANSYIQFYEKLKREVPNVIGNPHYWLQYSMSVMSENNLSDAERILKTAYSKAENTPGYDTTYIDNQYARLKLKQAVAEDDQNSSICLFLEAHKILVREDNDIFKFRQAGLYIPYYEERYDSLSKGNKVKFEHSIKEILSHYEEYLISEYPDGDTPPFQREIFNDFNSVIKSINQKRPV